MAIAQTKPKKQLAQADISAAKADSSLKHIEQMQREIIERMKIDTLQ